MSNPKGMVVKVLLAYGPDCDWTMAWLAGSRLAGRCAALNQVCPGGGFEAVALELVHSLGEGLDGWGGGHFGLELLEKCCCTGRWWRRPTLKTRHWHIWRLASIKIAVFERPRKEAQSPPTKKKVEKKNPPWTLHIWTLASINTAHLDFWTFTLSPESPSAAPYAHTAAQTSTSNMSTTSTTGASKSLPTAWHFGVGPNWQSTPP